MTDSIDRASAARWLVITGASSGIGRATAKLFLEHGYGVVNLSRRPARLPGIVDIRVDLAAADWPVGLTPELEPLVDAGLPITLIHNAARNVPDALGSLEIGEIWQSLEVNVIAPLTLTQMLLPAMVPESSVLFVGSTLSEKAVAGAFTYVTTKHAMVGMMRAACQDLAGRGIHTACICPGFTDTEMLRSHIPDAETLAAVGTQNAFGRLVEPGEIAATLLFAATNPVINGSVIHAGLGQTER